MSRREKRPTGSDPAAPPAGEPRVRVVPLSELKLDPRNARLHPLRNRSAIKGSLERFGAARSGVLDADGVVRAGNGTLAEAIEAGITEAVVIEVDGRRLVMVQRRDWDEAEAQAYGITDNRTSDLSTFDPGILSTLAPELQQHGIDLATLGWEPWELREASKDPGKPAIEDDPVPNAPSAEPVTRPGDLWALGGHRLLCSDSLVVGTWTRLLDGKPADMILTDPPYAIYGSATGIASDIADDRMVVPFFEAIFRLCRRHLKGFGHCYLHCDWRSWSAVWEGARRAGMSAKNCLVWDKKGSGLGANYANTHEFIGFFANLPKQTAMGERKGGQRPVYRSNILRFDRVRGDEREHNAAKPVGMLAEMIEASSEVGETVVDAFSGSGSTLMACERTGRLSRSIEVLPEACDVIIRRWERLTGQSAERIGTEIAEPSAG